MKELVNRIFGVKCGTCSHRKGGFFKRKCVCMKEEQWV
jgi:hypothetical protein